LIPDQEPDDSQGLDGNQELDDSQALGPDDKGQVPESELDDMDQGLEPDGNQGVLLDYNEDRVERVEQKFQQKL
jgi:hypothetical protein